MWPNKPSEAKPSSYWTKAERESWMAYLKDQPVEWEQIHRDEVARILATVEALEARASALEKALRECLDMVVASANVESYNALLDAT